MTSNFEDFQKLSKESVDKAIASFGAMQKGVQQIAVEVADYSKKAFEANSDVVQKLLGAKSLDKAIEIQSDFAKSAYEAFVAQMTKLNELTVDTAKDAYKPFESAMAK